MSDPLPLASLFTEEPLKRFVTEALLKSLVAEEVLKSLFTDEVLKCSSTEALPRTRLSRSLASFMIPCYSLLTFILSVKNIVWH